MLLLQDYFKIVIPCSQQNNIPSDKNHFEDFPSKEKKMLHYAFGHAFGLVILCFAMLLLTQSTPKTRNLGSTTHSPRFGAKNEIYYSLLLFICHYSLLLFTVTIHLLLFTPNFAYLRGVVPYISSKVLVCLVQDFFPRESFHL